MNDADRAKIADGDFTEMPPTTADEAIRGLNEIFRYLQEHFHDQWNWIEAAFYLEVLKSLAREPLTLSATGSSQRGDSASERLALTTTCPHCHAPVDARCVSLHWAFRDDKWTPQYVYREPHSKRLKRAERFAWRKGDSIETTARI